jgi:hypothetical protein
MTAGRHTRQIHAGLALALSQLEAKPVERGFDRLKLRPHRDEIVAGQASRCAFTARRPCSNRLGAEFLDDPPQDREKTADDNAEPW